jgi:hypothetical protein
MTVLYFEQYPSDNFTNRDQHGIRYSSPFGDTRTTINPV